METGNKTYIIVYLVYLTDGHIESHKTRVKNSTHELFAKLKMEAHLQKIHGSLFARMEVIECREENPLNKLFNGFNF